MRKERSLEDSWWLLRRMGHNAVTVLDGGFPVWLAQQGAIETTTRAPRQPGNFRPRMQQGFTVDTQQLLESSEWLVVDARAPERFRGESEPIDPVAGTIPGAVNRPLTDNLRNGLFKSAEQLRAAGMIFLAQPSLTR